MQVLTNFSHCMRRVSRRIFHLPSLPSSLFSRCFVVYICLSFSSQQGAGSDTHICRWAQAAIPANDTRKRTCISVTAARSCERNTHRPGEGEGIKTKMSPFVSSEKSTKIDRIFSVAGALPKLFSHGNNWGLLEKITKTITMSPTFCNTVLNNCASAKRWVCGKLYSLAYDMKQEGASLFRCLSAECCCCCCFCCWFSLFVVVEDVTTMYHESAV